MPKGPLRPTMDDIVKRYEATWDDYEHFRDTGNPLAVDECVIACYKAEKPLPQWVIRELAQRSHRQIEKARQQFERRRKKRTGSFTAIMLSPREVKPDKGGVGRSYLKFHDKRELVLAVDTARYGGLTFEKACEAAGDYLRANGYEYTRGTIEKRYWELREKLTAGAFAWDANLNLMIEFINRHHPNHGKKARKVSSGRRG